MNINNIVVCPDCKKRLASGLLCKNCKRRFKIKKGIPILLPKSLDMDIGDWPIDLG